MTIGQKAASQPTHVVTKLRGPTTRLIDDLDVITCRRPVSAGHLCHCDHLVFHLLVRFSREYNRNPIRNFTDNPRSASRKEKRAGRTDLEIRTLNALLVFEANRAWLLPSKSQLRRYVGRIHHQDGGALVTLSQASRPLAAGIPVTVS